ncbi:hypothetical protein E0L17_01390 [Olsenella sp. SW781]|uniref:hypothetical protein n=1 Tax=Olsenella sp. SW781 TaxID=2530046 RepID=UPI001438D85A|nr:hypothetical protein [Olsenella sp. SW781]NJE79991.1 hypothetical protein [Olsenella sp. SW781]
MGNPDGGFINERTGAYVSPERAHQHVGEEHAFDGYEKARSRSTGNFYMRETGSGAPSSVNSALEALENIERTRSLMRMTSMPGILGYDGRSA